MRCPCLLGLRPRLTRAANPGASYRYDGNLLVAGGEDPVVQVFDANSRVILRQFSGHTRSVHVTRFSNSGTKIFSGSDGKTVKVWDIPSQAEVVSYQEHEVREPRLKRCA